MFGSVLKVPLPPCHADALFSIYKLAPATFSFWIRLSFSVDMYCYHNSEDALVVADIDHRNLQSCNTNVFQDSYSLAAENRQQKISQFIPDLNENYKLLFNYHDFTDHFFQVPNKNEELRRYMSEQRKLNKKAIPNHLKNERRMKRNERERARQHRLNKAIDVLRQVLPSYLTPYENGHRLTQIETLKNAIKYIRLLSDLLENDKIENHCI